jgi:membrane protease YdiL (CAAX protease family)
MDRRRAAELVAIVACFVALREVTGRTQLAIAEVIHWHWMGLAFYALWIPPCAIAIHAWGMPRWVPQRRVWTRRNVVVLGLVWLAAEAMYGFKLCNIVLGYVSLHPPAFWQLEVNAAVAAPVIEELVFRGLLWHAIAKRTNTWTAFAVTTVLFGIWHWSSMLDPSFYGASGTPIHVHAMFGAVMAAARWRFDAIGPSIAIHGLYNGLWAVTSAV